MLRQEVNIDQYPVIMKLTKKENLDCQRTGEENAFTKKKTALLLNKLKSSSSVEQNN